MRFKFIGKERKFTCGRWYSPGQIVESDTKPNNLFEKISKKEEI